MHAGVVDLSLDDVDAEDGGGAHGLSAFAGCKQRLRRHAPKVEAVAAHAAFFDEDDRHPELGCGRRDGKAT